MGAVGGSSAAAMTNLERRLKKLEAGLIDNAGLVPYSPRWRAVWLERMEELFGGEDSDPPVVPSWGPGERLTIEQWDYLVAYIESEA
jgi:hypothetical protein